ncbi:hypothetical protein GCM10023161_16270 [Mycobacterium paraffinicum]|uniref:Uncharacterized protein n=1 Tax=Mycobacterium paraffinicum TaxID=53378 RepID=A0ABP8RH73_9MYCO
MGPTSKRVTGRPRGEQGGPVNYSDAGMGRFGSTHSDDLVGGLLDQSVTFSSRARMSRLKHPI